MYVIGKPQICRKPVIHQLIRHICQRGIHCIQLHTGEEQQRLIQQMHAPVQHHAAAVFLFLAPVSRNPPGTMHSGFQTENFSQTALVQYLFHREKVLVPAAVLMHCQKLSRSRRRVYHLLQIVGAQRHRLLRHHILSCLHSLNGDAFMHVIGSGDQHQIHRLIRQKILQTFIYMNLPGRRVIPSFFLDVPDPGHSQILYVLNQIVMPAGHAAEAHYRQSMFHFNLHTQALYFSGQSTRCCCSRQSRESAAK